MKRITIAVIGGTVLLFGIVLIVLPGPAFIVIPAGLAILATEFAWAGRWLEKLKCFFRTQRDKMKKRKL
ncbi:MAG: PGPGW domain-containing protein [Verrucomicrobiota bacterium]